MEVQREEAESLLKQYNEEGRKAGPPPEKRFDNRQGGFRGRGGGGGYQRYDNRDGPRGGYQSRSGDGGSGYRGGEKQKQIKSKKLFVKILKAEDLIEVKKKEKKQV